MRVLLHTPLKPPDSPLPSGDREMARGLARLLRRLGHRVVMPALSRVAPGVPKPEAHLALQRRARAQAARLIARWRALPPRHPERFDLWFTYHCYYRKPDWLGPLVTRALGIPYVIAEASHAPRRAQGATRLGHRAVERALAAADLVLTVNPRDVAGVKARLRPGARQRWLPPFIDIAPFAASHARNDPPLLLSVGMMRTRDKLDSYRVLARAFAHLRDRTVEGGAGRRRPGAGRGRGPDGAVRRSGALRRRRAAPANCRRSMPPPTFTSGRRSTKPMAWHSSKPRRPGCPWSPAAPAACRPSWPTASPACLRRSAIPWPSPPPSAACSTIPPNGRGSAPAPPAASPAIMTSVRRPAPLAAALRTLR